MKSQKYLSNWFYIISADVVKTPRYVNVGSNFNFGCMRIINFPIFLLFY